MSESPYIRYKDVLIHDHSPSANCLRSIVLSMNAPFRYHVTADDLAQLKPEHFDALQALLGVYREGLDDNRDARDVIREIEAAWPDYRKAPCGLYPFPDPESVFVPDQAHLIEHLQPFFGIDLSLVNPEWSGYLTMLGPLEPTEHEFVGQATEETPWQSILLHTNWIGFKVEEGRYRLMGDPRFFFLHPDNAHLADPYVEARERLEEHYTHQKAAYDAARQYYQKTGQLLEPSELARNAPLRDIERLTFVEQIGGVADYLKFPRSSLALASARCEKSGVLAGYPVSPAGNPFHHVASVPAAHYQSWGADLVMMFYEPVEQLVLFTFYWEDSESKGSDGRSDW